MKYSDLKPEQKLQVLGAIKDGLYHHLKSALYNITYLHLIMDLKGKEKFSIERIFEKIPPKNAEHINHIDPYLKIIDEEIESVQNEMIQTDFDDE